MKIIATTLVLGLATAAQAEVTVLGWPGGPEEEALRAATEAYNARSETAEADRVELLFFSRDGFWDKLQADLAAGTDAFDANLLATYSIGRYAPFMEPVDLGLEAEAVYGDAVLDTMRFEGEQYGVPTDLSLHFLYYRQDLIDDLMASDEARARYTEIAEERLGQALEPKDPDDWTWDDYAATALYFTAAVNPDSPTRYGTVLQMKNLLFNVMVWHSVPRSYGADWQTDGAVALDSDAWRNGLELWRTLYDAGATPPDSLSYEYAEANAAFLSGQVATMLQWNAAAGELTDPETSPLAEDVATVAPPAGPEGRYTHIHGLGLGLNANAPNKEGATRFLQWLSTPEGTLTYARAGGAPALTPEVVAEVASERPDLERLGAFAGEYGFVMEGGTSENALAVYEAQAEAFTGYWSGQATLDEAISEAEAAMTDLLQ